MLQQQQSFQNTFPILAQQTKLRRADKLFLNIQRSQDTGELLGTMKKYMIICMLLRWVFSQSWMMSFLENFIGTMKCTNVEVLETTASQNYHGEWITGVSFS